MVTQDLTGLFLFKETLELADCYLCKWLIKILFFDNCLPTFAKTRKAENELHNYFEYNSVSDSLREKCPNTEFFLVRIGTLFARSDLRVCFFLLSCIPFKIF